MHKRTVGETMTPHPIILSPATPVDHALEVARERKIHHLLVQGDDGIVNVVCLCDILERDPLDDSFEGTHRVHDDRALSEFARHRTFVVGPGDSVNDAGDLMAREGIGCLPVVRNGEVVGVLTRADLGKTGELYDAILDARCASCGSTEDIRHAVPGGAGFCPSCWSSDGPPLRDDEIGGGD